MFIERIVTELVEKFSNEIQKSKNRNLFQVHVLDPIIQHAFSRLFPYIIITSVVFLLTFVLAVAILFLLLTTRSGAK